MVTPPVFRVVPDAEARARWDGWLAGFADRGIRQSFAWGESKRGAWTPVRCGLFSGETPLVLASALERAAPLGLASVSWTNAGPVFRRGGAAGDAKALAAFLEGFKGLWGRRTLVRLGPRDAAGPEAEAALAAAGFRPSASPLDSGLTSVLSLAPSAEDLRAALDRKWRNQLKKAEAAAPRVDFGRGPDLRARYHALHDAMCARKGLKAERVSLGALEDAVAAFGGSLTFAVASAGGVDGAGASWWTFAGRATLWLSASNAAGMAGSLPNALYWAVILRLKEEGAREFDLSGLDPERNPGVTHFKRGLGGAEVRTLGEWDWSPSPVTRSALSAALKALRGRLSR